MEHKLHILLITLLALLVGACISPRDRETTLKLNRLERKLDSLPGRESGQPLLDSLRAIPPRPSPPTASAPTTPSSSPRPAGRRNSR